MRILSLEAKDVFGHLKLSAKFNEDLNFITGMNGSGKTTCLKLIDAILNIKLSVLALTEFKHVVLKIHDDKQREHTIEVVKAKNHLLIKTDKIQKDFKVPLVGVNEYEIYESEKDSTEYYDELKYSESENPVLQFLMKLPDIMFLGLERRFDNLDPRLGGVFKRTGYSVKRKYLKSGSMSSRLSQVRRLIAEHFRHVKRQDNELDHDLKFKLFSTSFKHVPVSPNIFDPSLREEISKTKDLLEKKEHVIDLVTSVFGDKDNTLAVGLEKYFNKVETMVKEVDRAKKESNEGINIDWIVNYGNIVRLKDIYKAIDDYKEKRDKIFSKVNVFLDKVNSFFIDTDKHLGLDSTGSLTISYGGNKKVHSLKALSSGEMQILIILAYLIFVPKRNEETIIVIDEPELSLHLAWQEAFVQTLLSVNNKVQYIFATHSPDIIDVYDEKCISIKGP